MAIVAKKYGYVIGIDTHARIYTYPIIDTELVPELRNIPSIWVWYGQSHRLDSTQYHERNHCCGGRKEIIWDVDLP